MNITPFNFNSNSIRVLELDNEPMFVAKDVADLLGYTNSRKSVADHCKGVTKRYIPTSSGEQEMSLIPERDVYRLIMRSKMPEAEKFEDWVVSEVLPSIRKTGAYESKTSFIVPKDLPGALRLAADMADRLEQAQPAIEFSKAVGESVNSVTVQDFAKAMGTGQNKLFVQLRTHGYLMSGGLNHNKPYQRFVDQGLFSLTERIFKNTSTGENSTYFKTLITGKGQMFFHNKYFSQTTESA